VLCKEEHIALFRNVSVENITVPKILPTNQEVHLGT